MAASPAKEKTESSSVPSEPGQARPNTPGQYQATISKHEAAVWATVPVAFCQVQGAGAEQGVQSAA